MSTAYAELGPVVPPASAPAGLAAEVALLITLTLQRLKRVVTQPGSGDRTFIRDLAGVHPVRMSDAQRAHVLRLAWRYRFSLPVNLRPARDPDLKPVLEAH